MGIQVAVVGGGYAGVMAANRLAGLGDGVDVVLVNERDFFVERIRLHEFVSGVRSLPGLPYQQLLHPSVRRMTARVSSIDARRSRLLFADGDPLDYDYLVYAAGSTGRQEAGRDAVVPRAGHLEMSTAQDAVRARDAVKDLSPGSSVVILGAGHTGIELASELRQSRRDIHVHMLARGAVGGALGTAGSKRAERALRRAGVQVHKREETLPKPALVLRADGFIGASLAADSGLPVNDRGQLEVGSDQRVGHHPNIVGAGDGCHIQGDRNAHMRMGCASALPQGAHAGDVVRALIRGDVPSALSAGFVVQCVSLGRKQGLIQFVKPDDRPRRMHVSGRGAAAMKELVCRQTVTWMRNEARRPGSYRWPAGPKGMLNE